MCGDRTVPRHPLPAPVSRPGEALHAPSAAGTQERMLRERNLLAAPVLDAGGVMRGIVTLDELIRRREQEVG